MKKRNPYLVTFLSWITFGIYNFFWLYASRREMVKKGADIPPFWWIFLPLLLVFGAAWALVFHFLWLPNHNASAALTNTVNTLSLIFGLIGIIGMPLLVYWFWKFCGGVDRLTKGSLAQVRIFWLFIGLLILESIVSNSSGLSQQGHFWSIGSITGVIGSIWFGIIQNGFNKVK